MVAGIMIEAAQAAQFNREQAAAPVNEPAHAGAGPLDHDNGIKSERIREQIDCLEE